MHYQGIIILVFLYLNDPNAISKPKYGQKVCEMTFIISIP
jgi:hypothetical protein